MSALHTVLIRYGNRGNRVGSWRYLWFRVLCRDDDLEGVVTFEGAVTEKTDVKTHGLRGRPKREIAGLKGHAGASLKVIVNATHCNS